jgi:hypothetical protein
MHAYDTLTQLTHEHRRDHERTARTERLAATARTARRRRRLGLAASLELLLGARHAARLRAEA